MPYGTTRPRSTKILKRVYIERADDDILRSVAKYFGVSVGSIIRDATRWYAARMRRVIRRAEAEFDAANPPRTMPPPPGGDDDTTDG